jgi:hypothetical protein
LKKGWNSGCVQGKRGSSTHEQDQAKQIGLGQVPEANTDPLESLTGLDMSSPFPICQHVSYAAQLRIHFE